MCGIAGLYNYAESERDERADLCRMRDTMTHRGPDASGLYQSPDHRVLFGHRRLSIVDLSEAGRQPMSNEDGSIWITFNGEIYNHQQYRAPLLAKGHRFRSHTDTECIIHLYEEVGVECISRLDGMFAFGLWDQNRRRLLLARDRLGKKPVYYTVSGGKLLFASEIKALLEYPGIARDVDIKALGHFLTFSNTPAPFTLFRNIHKLAAAHMLICDAAGNIRTERYWSPLDGAGWGKEVREEECVEQVRELLGRAVEKRLMSDVPVGAFLSGGIDSSANVALMSQLVSEPLRTFSIGFEGFGEAENFHDLPYARQIAREFGCNHQDVTITADHCRKSLPELIYHQDEPIGDPACLPMHFVSQAAKQHGVTVVLVGEGSDEVFGGYSDFVHMLAKHASRWKPLLRLPQRLRQVIYSVARTTGTTNGRLDIFRRAARNDPFYWGLDVVFWDSQKESLLRPEARSIFGEGSAPVIRSYYQEICARQPAADFLQQMSYVELCNRLPELLLMRVDKFSMAHSLEARAPFLDYQLVSYALSLPQNSKIQGQTTKHVLKQAVTGLLPQEIIKRKKQGFRVPLPEWLHGPLSGWAEERLFSPAARRLDFFNFDHIRELWQGHKSGSHDNSFDLWCLINLFSWYECWFD
jgi:asparagine synthase (glutamine-hydrolysing)